MSTKRLRDLQRGLHLGASAVLGTYLYSPWSDVPAFAWVVKAGVVPALVLTGLVMWQLPRLRRAVGTSRSRPSMAARDGR